MNKLDTELSKRKQHAHFAIPFKETEIDGNKLGLSPVFDSIATL